MSVKPAAKPGAKPSKANPADQVMQDKLDQLGMLKRQCEAHERMLQVSSEQLQRSELEIINFKKRIVELNEKFKAEENLSSSMTHNMFRVYTEMQRKLMERIESHQSTIRGLRKELGDARLSLERTKAEKDAICADKTRKINEQKQKMEEMASAFGIKLKETLEKMSAHMQEERGHSLGHSSLH
jgi:predicted  nucleic acid-binding Zn-ribbon protein